MLIAGVTPANETCCPTNALATNSGPLSERMCSGTPRRMNRSESTSMTSIDLSRRATRMARHSWVNSSMMLSRRSCAGHGCAPRGSRRTRRDWGARPAAGCTIHHSATGERAWVVGRDLQPLASPDPFDPLVVDQPACPAQQLGDLAVAVATILPSQLDHVL